MTEQAKIKLAYTLWRWQMWFEGYGSYEDIEWATRYRIVTPFRDPRKTAKPRKLIIGILRHKPDRDY